MSRPPTTFDFTRIWRPFNRLQGLGNGVFPSITPYFIRLSSALIFCYSLPLAIADRSALLIYMNRVLSIAFLFVSDMLFVVL